MRINRKKRTIVITNNACPDCGNHEAYKFGTRFIHSTKQKIPRYLCSECGKIYTEISKKIKSYTCKGIWRTHKSKLN